MDEYMRELNHIEWEDYYMKIAEVAAQRSKNEISPSGACIVNKSKQVVGIGWDGMPLGFDNKLSWRSYIEGENIDLKYKYVIPAICNAHFYRTQKNTKDCKVYVTTFPTNECANIIAKCGIKEVIYLPGELRRTESVARMILENAGVTMRPVAIEPNNVYNFPVPPRM